MSSLSEEIAKWRRNSMADLAASGNPGWQDYLVEFQINSRATGEFDDLEMQIAEKLLEVSNDRLQGRSKP